MLQKRLPILVLSSIFLLLGLKNNNDLSAALGQGQPPQEGWLSKKQLKEQFPEFEKAYNDIEFDKAIKKLRTLAPLPVLQEMLGDLYPESNPKNRVLILHILNHIGVEKASRAIPVIAADFAVARPKHPNDMSFASFYVLEKFMHLAYKKLPAERDQEKKADIPANLNKPLVKLPDPNLPTLASKDSFTHTGTFKDRTAICDILRKQKLNVSDRDKEKNYPLPLALETDWIRIIGNHAFVRLRDESSGGDFLFVNQNGKWSYQASLGHWVN